jgi:DNA mismatch endonuclease (patch repair protein)
MADVFSKRKRSEVMARIRGRGNKDTELALTKIFRAKRITGWRRHVEIRGRAALPRGPRIKAAQQRRPTSNKRTARRSVPASKPGAHGVTRPTKDRTARGSVPAFRVRPDFVFRQVRLALFVDGCFWHCCPLHATQPRHNATFWRRKLATNRARDRLVTRTLRKAGWRVLRLWEHELARKHEARLLRRIRRALA